jgi:hypothetical protein
LAGGQLSTGAGTSSAETYEPTTGLFAITGSMNVGRDFHTASLLPNGQVLIAAGGGAVSRPASAELYDPASGSFLLPGSLEQTRLYHTATALTNGTVVIAGGFAGQLLSSVESDNPPTAIFTSQSVFMSVARAGHVATQLAEGRVLFTGGQGAFSNVISIAEIYDPAARTFSLTSSLIQALGRRRQRLVTQFLWLLLLVAVAGSGACGSSVTGTSVTAPSNPDPVTPSTAYTISVTATSASGAVSHCFPLTLAVM